MVECGNDTFYNKMIDEFDKKKWRIDLYMNFTWFYSFAINER